VSAALLYAVTAAGCAAARGQASTPVTTAADLAGVESAVERARENGSEPDRAITEHLNMAERALAEAKDRAAAGDHRAARLLLARAQADADLSEALGRRERALADAEALEKQLIETRNTMAAAPAASATGAPGDLSQIAAPTQGPAPIQAPPPNQAFTPSQAPAPTQAPPPTQASAPGAGTVQPAADREVVP
jgi:hypothetical protein